MEHFMATLHFGIDSSIQVSARIRKVYLFQSAWYLFSSIYPYLPVNLESTDRFVKN